MTAATAKKILVPVLRGGDPMDANHSGPLFRIWGRFANVSTLLTTVGLL